MTKANFWATRRFVVTGGTGFLGSHLVRQMEERGAVLGRNLFTPHRPGYDFRHRRSIMHMLEDMSPDVIIHLAAHVGGIGANQAKPAEMLYDNASMGLQLMHEAQRAGVGKFVTVGTVCAYPKYAPVPFKESSLWDGYPEETNAPYGIAKLLLLAQGQAYRQQYGFNAIYLLPTNLYGPGDNFDPASSHVIPALIRRALEAKNHGDTTLTVWGTGQASREFLYVEDAAEGILRATEQYNKEEPVNLGCGEEVTIRQLVETIVAAVGFKGQVIWDTEKPDGQPRRKLDTSRAEELFDFRAKTAFAEGLRRTIEWYVSHGGSPLYRTALIDAGGTSTVEYAATGK